MTEMLAFLWQAEPDLVSPWFDSLSPALGDVSPWEIETQFILPSGRRPDVVLSCPGEAVVVVEAKLGSSAGPDQLDEYVSYLASLRAEPLRALVFLTERPEELPTSLASVARDHVLVLATRWQDMTGLLNHHSSELAKDFLQMLEHESLVVPPALGISDFERWSAGVRALERIRKFLDEARPRLSQLAPGFKKTGPLSTNPVYAYRLHTFEDLTFGLGFSPGNAERPSVINTVVLDETLDPKERAAAAKRAIEHPSGECDYIWWGEWPTRSKLAADVLTADDFVQQLDQAVAFADESLRKFREIGYLSALP